MNLRKQGLTSNISIIRSAHMDAVFGAQGAPWAPTLPQNRMPATQLPGPPPLPSGHMAPGSGISSVPQVPTVFFMLSTHGCLWIKWFIWLMTSLVFLQQPPDMEDDFLEEFIILKEEVINLFFWTKKPGRTASGNAKGEASVIVWSKAWYSSLVSIVVEFQLAFCINIDFLIRFNNHVLFQQCHMLHYL